MNDSNEPRPYLLGAGLSADLEPALARVQHALELPDARAFAADLRHREFPGSDFVGPYEAAGIAIGVYQEQWLWQHRQLIRGNVLDMSSVRHWNAFVHELPAVERVLIGDLDQPTVEKLGHSSPVDVIGDFCATPPPLPSASLDTVLCLSVLEHCADPFAMTRNLASCLRPGGHLLTMTPFAYVDGHLRPDNWRFCQNGYRVLAKQAGLTALATGQCGELGKYALFEVGRSFAPDGDRHGVPIANWLLARRD